MNAVLRFTFIATIFSVVLLSASLSGGCLNPKTQSPDQAQSTSPFQSTEKTRQQPPSDDDATILLRQARAIFGKLPEAMPGSAADTSEMIALGQKLYFEKGMSVNKTQSCNDCHNIGANEAAVDNRTTSPGALNKFGPRNSPTVFNAGLQISQFWDGRAATLEEQAKGPPLNPIEMGMESPEAVVKRVQRLDSYDYQSLFQEVFPDQSEPLTFDNIAEAIAAFERTFISKSRFDQFIDGDQSALTAGEKEGLALSIAFEEALKT